MARTSKISMTTPAGRTLTLTPDRYGGYWIACGREEVGSAASIEAVTPARLAQIDSILGEAEEHGGYEVASPAIDGGAY